MWGFFFCFFFGLWEHIPSLDGHPWLGIPWGCGCPLSAQIRVRQSNPGSVELLGRFSYLNQVSMDCPHIYDHLLSSVQIEKGFFLPSDQGEGQKQLWVLPWVFWGVRGRAEEPGG